MATRKRGMKAIPNLYSQGKDVFPVTAFRKLATLTSFTSITDNIKETVDLDLQFEDNEVLDVISVRTVFSWDFTAELTQDADPSLLVALFEDPDKPVSTDLSTEALFEDDTSLLYMTQDAYLIDFGDATGESVTHTQCETYFVFPQPYTVARNLAIIVQPAVAEGDPIVAKVRTEIWGRRRNATDAEFKNIIYRQRF